MIMDSDNFRMGWAAPQWYMCKSMPTPRAYFALKMASAVRTVMPPSFFGYKL